MINLCDEVPFYSNAFVHPCACEMADLFVNCWIHCSKICPKDSTAWSSALGSTGHNIKPYVSNSTGQQFVQRGEKWNGMKLMWIFNGNPKDLCRYHGHYLHFFCAIACITTVSVVFWGCLPTSSGCKVMVRQNMSGDVSAMHTGWCSCLQVEVMKDDEVQI